MRGAAKTIAIIAVLGLVACAMPRLTPRGSFGLASMALPTSSPREVAPVRVTVCGAPGEAADYAAAVEEALRQNPPANAILDAELTVRGRDDRRLCMEVIGTAVVLE